MSNRLTRRQVVLYLVIAVILGTGATYWVSDLTSDPPTYFAGSGQSLATDPPQYIYHARNKALFGDWDPFDYGRWSVFRHSLTSYVSSLWFSIAGVSRQQAAIVGVMLSLMALFALLIAVGRSHRPWVVGAVAFCYLVNVTLLTYGRLPYLENGLIFISSLIFLVYAVWGHRMLGALAAGALVGPAIFMGKLFGALALPALAVAILGSKHANRWRLLAACVTASVASSVALLLTLYGGKVSALGAYAGEQAYGLYGLPSGLMSPWAFVEHLISYGYENRLWAFNPELLLFLVIGISMLILLGRETQQRRPISRITALALSWIVCNVVLMAQLDYSPIRYALCCLPAIIVLFFTTIDYFLACTDNTLIRRPNLPGTVVLIILLWICFFQAVANPFYFYTSETPVRWLVWITLAPSCLVVLLGRRLLHRRRVRLGRRTMIIGLTLLLSGSALNNARSLWQTHHLHRGFTIAAASDDLQMILSEPAVVSGPYGPLLTLDTPMRSFIHMFGVAEVDHTLFDRYPVTHLAMDLSNWQRAIEAYPALANVPAITSYRIRDFEVRLFNISKAFNNHRATSYPETRYEIANRLFLMGQLDSARVEVELFLEQHPASMSGGLLNGDILWAMKRYDDVITRMTSLADRFVDEYNIQLQCGRYLQIISGMREDRRLLDLSRKYYQRAVDAAPYRQQDVRQLYDEIMQNMRDQVRPSGK